MATWITTQELDTELEALQSAGELTSVVAKCGKQQWSYPALLLAIASRETWMTNICGDPMTPYGHGKGMWQIDNRSHLGWLESVPGVRSGTFGPVVPNTHAADVGMVPTLADGVSQAILILEGNWNGAVASGVPAQELARVMVSAYNAGLGGALSGYHQTGNPDAYTTGGNYAEDVFQRETLVHAYLKAHKLV